MNSFIIDQKSLFSVLSWMQPICTKRTTMDITSSILFFVGPRELVLKSTDLEISLQTICLMEESDVVEPQQFLVSGKRIFDVVKELEGPITCTYHDNQLIIKANAVDVALNTKDVEGFPPFPERIENIMQLDAQALLTMLDKVAFLIPQNNANPALNGLLVEIGPDGLVMTTTDAHSLAQVSSSGYCLPEAKNGYYRAVPCLN
jgi:DNA polymerase III sliding clamp (beta) subunit (PCNA family)